MRCKGCTTISYYLLSILGYTDALRGIIRLGLLSPDAHPALHDQVGEEQRMESKLSST